MAQYRLTDGDHVIRTTDGASIPPDPANRDYAKYLQWIEEGYTPDPYVPPVSSEESVGPTAVKRK